MNSPGPAIRAKGRRWTASSTHSSPVKRAESPLGSNNDLNGDSVVTSRTRAKPSRSRQSSPKHEFEGGLPARSPSLRASPASNSAATFFTPASQLSLGTPTHSLTMRSSAHANRLLLLTLVFVASLGFSLFSDTGSVPAHGRSRFARESDGKGMGGKFPTHGSTWPELATQWYGGRSRRAARELNEPIPALQLDLSLADLRHTELTQWNPKSVRETVPVVFYCSEANDAPCSRGHYALRSIHQAQRDNSAVHVIGPRECRQIFFRLGVGFEELLEYEEVFDWFVRNMGIPVYTHVRWFVLKRFMERHGYSRIFFAMPDVLLFANVSQAAAWLYPNVDVALPVRWPSMRPPPLPSQYPSIDIGTHIALLTYRGLSDICRFLHLVISTAAMGGDSSQADLVLLPQYSDRLLLGWYSFPECWQQAEKEPCLGKDWSLYGDSMRAKVAPPRVRVHSLLQPRPCLVSPWSRSIMCVFDNMFSLSSPGRRFAFGKSDRIPTSRNYTYFTAWTEEIQTEPIQFMAIHCHGHKRKTIYRGYVAPNQILMTNLPSLVPG